MDENNELKLKITNLQEIDRLKHLNMDNQAANGNRHRISNGKLSAFCTA